MHILERIAEAARDLQCVGDRQYAYGLHEPVQRLPFDVLHDDVGPALLFDRNDLQNPRVIQYFADFFFPLKTRIERGIGLQIHERNFYGDGLSGLPVDCLEDGAHAAAVNRFDDFEAIVQHLSHFDIDTAGSRGIWGFRPCSKGRQSLIKSGFADLFNAYDLDRDIVLGSAIFGGVDEVLTSIRWSHARHHVGKFVFHEQRVQPVRTKNDAVSIHQSRFGEVDLDDGILAERARQDRSQLAGHRIFLGNQAKLTLHLDVRVIRCELLDLAVADQIKAAIPDVPDIGFLVAKYTGRQRGPHPPQLGFDTEVIDIEVGFFEDLIENLIGFAAVRSGLEIIQRDVDRHPAGNFARA